MNNKLFLTNRNIMKNIVRSSVLTAICIIAISCATGKKTADTTSVSPLAGKASVSPGSVVYALPRTVFNIIVEMDRTTEIPGPYWRYANELLGLDNVIQENNEYWTITGVSVESGEELDPSQFYVIESNSLIETNVLALRNEGLILDLNPGIYYTRGTNNQTETNETGRFVQKDLGSDEYFSVQRDTAFRRVTVDSTFIRIPYIVEKRRPLPAEQLAERAARRLMEMREGKHFILTGEADVLPQSDAVINEMNRLEKEYLELFTGKAFSERRTFTFQVIPTPENAVKPTRLFQFSELTGTAQNQASGDPVMLELTPEKRTGTLSVLRASQSLPGENNLNRLYYRVPDVVNMKITLGNEVLFNSRRLVYQLGEVIQLPANMLIGR
jgi:hypothetical protein